MSKQRMPTASYSFHILLFSNTFIFAEWLTSASWQTRCESLIGLFTTRFYNMMNNFDDDKFVSWCFWWPYLYQQLQMKMSYRTFRVNFGLNERLHKLKICKDVYIRKHDFWWIRNKTHCHIYEYNNCCKCKCIKIWPECSSSPERRKHP